MLSGQRLLWQRKSSIGETLDGLPGVSATGFGPFVSRPVIRGLDGDRIRVLQNGTGALDASSLSFDHAVPYDPLAAERIEVVRGAAAVLYGGSAVGGVVNVIDNRIPAEPLSGATGRAEARVGGADRGSTDRPGPAWRRPPPRKGPARGPFSHAGPPAGARKCLISGARRGFARDYVAAQ